MNQSALAPMTATTSPTSTTEVIPGVTRIRLFHHRGAPQWGRARLAWERRDKRGYEFEDGKLRVFKRGYYGFLKEACLEPVELARIHGELDRMFGTRETPKRRTARGTGTGGGPSLSAQIQLFRSRFSDGFADATWRSKARSGGRRLKRHREPALEEAARLLGADTLDQLIEQGAFAEVLGRAAKIIAATDLAKATDAARLARVLPEHATSLVLCLRELVCGTEPEAIRIARYFAALRRAIGKEPDWRIATALPALLFPETHIAVRPPAMRAQAALVAGDFVLPAKINASAYLRARDIVSTVAGRLEDEGLQPADRLDVVDFIWETVRPAARKELEAMADADAEPALPARAAKAGLIEGVALEPANDGRPSLPSVIVVDQKGAA